MRFRGICHERTDFAAVVSTDSWLGKEIGNRNAPDHASFLGDRGGAERKRAFAPKPRSPRAQVAAGGVEQLPW